MNQEPYNWYRPDGFRPEEDAGRQHTTSQISDTNPSESSCQIHTDSKHTSFFQLKPVLLILLGIAVLFALIAGTAILSRNTDASSPSTSSLPPDSDTLEDNPNEENPDKKDYSDFFEKVYGDSSISSGKNSLPTVAGEPIGSPILSSVGSGGEALDLTTLYARCSPSVVSVSAYWDDGSYAWGSGILCSSDGYLVTNNHVIENAVSAEVTLADDRSYEAALVGYDVQTDLAVLKIDAEGLTPAVFGDSDTLQIGETVVAIGNPIGPEYRNTMTDGILSAIGREVTTNGYSMLLLQTNAAINEGNSGGPLFNRYGQVIGITNMKIASPYSGVEGIGFSIPSNTVIDIVNTLVQQGSISRGSIGVTLGEIPEELTAYYDIPQGLYISAVNEDSDAYAQGVQAGDILTEVNGNPVYTTDDVMKIRDSLQIGDSLTLTLYRKGKYRTIDVEIYDSGAVE